ncbi:MAG: ABC transporter permease [Clostridia bacterium]
MGLLFLNAFKGLKKKKIQMLGIIIMVILSSAIYTAMNTALDRIEDRYKKYLNTQAVEDFSFSLKVDYDKDFTKAEIEDLKKNELKDLPKEQMQVINAYQMSLGIDNFPNKADLHKYVAYIMQSTGALNTKLDDKVKDAKTKYDFSYQIEKAKISTEEKFIYKAMVYNKDAKLNIPYLVDGKMPEAEDEITLLPAFARENKIGIGDIYSIGSKEYEVVGFAYAPDHIYPMLSFNSPIFDERYNSIVYMKNDTFENFSGIKEVAYVAKFNDDKKQLEIDEMKQMFEENKDIEFSMMTVARKARIQMLEMEIANDRLFAEYFLYLLLGISVFIIVVVTKKRIEDEKLQIGVLKALGYRSMQIAISYLVYPLVGAIIGGTIGYFIGIYMHEFITTLLVSYFNLPVDGFVFSLKYLYVSVGIPALVLSLLTFIISMIMLRHKPLYLLKEGSNLKVNFFNRFISKITRGFSFRTRFKYSLASRSLGKLFIVTLTSFCCGLLLVLILIGMNLFSSMIMSTFNGLNFDYMVSYANTKEGKSKTEDYIFEKSLVVDKVLKQDLEDEEKYTEEVPKREDFKVTLDGVEPKMKYMDVTDKEGKKILTKLKEENSIIINKNVKEILEVEIGDKLIFKNEDDGKEYALKIIGVQESFMGSAGYMEREKMSQIYGLENAYNKKYTKLEKYGNMSDLDKKELDEITGIFGVSDLKRNMETQMEASNAIIYVIIGFASFMALIIIAVIANIVIEENKKTISLMKVMGYENKRISAVVLNIYTPFVIVAYLASIPVMKGILVLIIKTLTKDLDFAIPIELSMFKAAVGLVGLLIAYYGAIFASRKVLNKVPLATALKRE